MLPNTPEGRVDAAAHLITHCLGTYLALELTPEQVAAEEVSIHAAATAGIYEAFKAAERGYAKSTPFKRDQVWELTIKAYAISVAEDYLERRRAPAPKKAVHEPGLRVIDDELVGDYAGVYDDSAHPKERYDF